MVRLESTCVNAARQACQQATCKPRSTYSTMYSTTPLPADVIAASATGDSKIACIRPSTGPSPREAGIITSQWYPGSPAQHSTAQHSTAKCIASYRIASHASQAHRIASHRIIPRTDCLVCAGPVSLSSSITSTRQTWAKSNTHQPTPGQTVSRHCSAEYHHILPTRLTASHKKPLFLPPGRPRRTMHLTTPQRPSS